MSLSSSSSGSSRLTQRTDYRGVPTRCWCGERVVTFTSKTEENPFRRFYRCTNGLKMKKEEHLFKWIDEGIVEEIQKVDGKIREIAEEVNDLRKQMLKNNEHQKAMFEKLEEKLVKKIDDKIDQELVVVKEELGSIMAKSNWKIVGIVIVIMSTSIWFWGK